ncbi:GntR family transcriptional regulator [Marinilactibacillus sp. GCM10026970]|uniref:GntR family transcriptional regulator n=1 Tax=Marinilactibacillus sp. GCM10026970 TaxID=3252642 RepID=UPI003610F9E0
MRDLSDTQEPLYKQVYKEILKQITDNQYKEGDILPSEKEFQDIYSVSRVTIRRAMEILQTNGYVKKSSGIGTVVINNKHALQLKKISSFSEDNSNRSTLSKLVSFEIIDAPANVQSKLFLNKETSVYKIERLRYTNGEKVGFQRSYIPTSEVKIDQEKLSASDASLYKIFKENDIKLTTANETIEAMLVTPFLEEHLNLVPASPLLYIERTAFDEKKGIELAEIYYRADRYKYQIQLEG